MGAGEADAVTPGVDAVAPEPEAAAAPARRVGRVVLVVLLGFAVLVQLVVLYAPSGPSAPPFPGSDKLVHALVFLVPVAVALLAGLPPRLVVAVFAGHAVVSEVVQGALLPTRSGDPLDVVADLVGVGLGVLVWRLLVRLVGRRAAAVAGG